MLFHKNFLNCRNCRPENGINPEHKKESNLDYVGARSNEQQKITSPMDIKTKCYYMEKKIILFYY